MNRLLLVGALVVVAAAAPAEEALGPQAVAVLDRLVAAGMPVSHAREVVSAALARRGPQDITALGESLELAYRRGVPAREILNLTRDLAEADVNGIVVAMDAVGRLAEEGYTDAETRRGVALRVLDGLRGGARGRDLAALGETIHDGARQEAETAKGEKGHGAQGRGKSGTAGDKQKDKIPPDLRDDRRGRPPGGPKGKPGGK